MGWILILSQLRTIIKTNLIQNEGTQTVIDKNSILDMPRQLAKKLFW